MSKTKEQLVQEQCVRYFGARNVQSQLRPTDDVLDAAEARRESFFDRLSAKTNAGFLLLRRLINMGTDC